MSVKLIALAAMCATAPVVLAGAPTALTTERIAVGLSRPVFVTHAPGDTSRIFVVEQRSGSIGRIRIVDLSTNTLEATPFLSISPVATGSEQGLLGMAFDPDYATNGYFYVNYTDSGWTTRVVRYQVSGDPDIANAASATPVLSVSQPAANHNGGWMAFGPDGYLYIAFGDGGSANDPWSATGNGQDINVLLGKILRIDPSGDDFPGDPGRNYSIPPSNPFAGATPGADEIWTWGMRNPWRNAFDRETGDLYLADVGQDFMEEISFQPASSTGGENYGWRCMEGTSCTGLSGCTCNGPTLELPFQTYAHGGAPFRCSITGGYVYRGCAIPDLRGTYFYSDYCSNQIWSLRYDGTTVTAFTDRTAELDPAGSLAILSPGSFGEDANGELYICDLNGGEVFRVIPAAGQLGDCCAIAATGADVNGDSAIDLNDLAEVLFNFGPVYDLNDISNVLFNFGADCYTP